MPGNTDDGRHRVLVVEDDPDIREALIQILEDSGYRPSGAVDGQDALDKLDAAPRSGGGLPCLILLDLMMPVMDGRMFREEQLRRPALSAIPVVVLSAYRDLETHIQGLGAVGHFHKPFKISQLLDVLRVHC
jgi:CheY-like chemotaxis protein